MSDFIEREPVAIFVEECGCSPKWIAKRIRNQEAFPAADVAPVRHGRWIEDERTYPGPGLANNLCSVCGEIAGAWKEGLAPERKWAYCPACGALMDGKEDEHEAG